VTLPNESEPVVPGANALAVISPHKHVTKMLMAQISCRIRDGSASSDGLAPKARAKETLILSADCALPRQEPGERAHQPLQTVQL
jgi:hypothetical protein